MQVFERRGSSAQAAQRSLSATPELRRLCAAGPQTRVRRGVWQGVRGLGALSLLAVGAVHLQQYVTLYSAIPTIGTLFVLNFAGATAIGLGLLVPVEHVFGRLGGGILALLTLGGIGLAAIAFTFLLVSERTPLFGFMEPGYDPPAIMASRVAELTTVIFLGSFFVVRFVRRLPVGRW
jgi:hypothetical protein